MAGGADALSATRLAACADGAPAGEAAAVVVLESAARRRTGRAAARAPARLGLGVTAQDAAAEALGQAGRAPVAVYANQAARGEASARFPALPVCAPESLCGDVQGATTALHLALALLAAHDGPVLVLTADVRVRGPRRRTRRYLIGVAASGGTFRLLRRIQQSLQEHAVSRPQVPLMSGGGGSTTAAISARNFR